MILTRSASASIQERRPSIGHDHLAPLVQCLSWLFLAFSILSVGVYFVTKRVLAVRFGPADLVLSLALVFGVGQISSLLSTAGQDIGNSPVGLPAERIDVALKTLYSFDMLNIVAQATTKAALLTALHALTPVSAHRRLIYATSILTIAWAVTAVFIVAFQCPGPQRWNVDNGNCTNMRAAQTYIATVNILTDIGLVIIPSVVVLKLNLPWSKRAAVMGAFCVRILVVAASVIQIIFTQHLAFDGHYTQSVWRTTVCKEIVQTASIMTACIPFLKPFLLSLESGFLRADKVDVQRTGQSVHSSGSKPSGWSTKPGYIEIPDLRRSRAEGQSADLEAPARVGA